MDWQRAIDRNHGALRRVLSALLAMAQAPSSARHADGGPGASRPCPHAVAPAGAGLRPLPASLPRRLHRAILRLLRPAEAAMRRLVVLAASRIALPCAPAADRSTTRINLLAALLSSGPAGSAGATKQGAAEAARPKRCAFALFDPPRRLPRLRRPACAAVPRIGFLWPEAPQPAPSRPPPCPSDPVDAARLALRLAALARALDDLPGQARRLARWRAVQAGRPFRPGRRLSPIRFGRAPSLARIDARRPRHEVHALLAELHGLARLALDRPDTS